MSESFLKTATHLASRGRRRPSQADLQRAVSTAYYALFRAISTTCADALVGVRKRSSADRAWIQAFRALNHGDAKKAARRIQSRRATLRFPPALVRVAISFVSLQELRHKADYDPDYRIKRADRLIHIETAASAIADLNSVSAKHKRAFAVYLILKPPRDEPA